VTDIPKWNQFREDFVTHAEERKEVYDSLTPHEVKFPGIFDGVWGLSRLCALRCIRPDKVVLAVQKCVREEMSDKFVRQASAL
jgi:dynein heavy chain, axonemal